MTTDLFAQVKEIPFEDVLSFYGIKQTRGHFAPCLFHGDSHPSMKAYKDHGYCFVCHTYVDGPKLVAQLFGLSQLEGAKKLAADFGLRVDDVSLEEIRQRRTRAEQAEKERAVVFQMVDSLAKMYFILNTLEKDYAPQKPQQLKRANKKYLLAVRYKDFVGSLLDEWQYSRTEEQERAWLGEICQNPEIYLLGKKLKKLKELKKEGKK